MYELFYIYFTSFHSTRENELNKLTSLPMYGFIAQLVEHRTGIAEVTGSNPVEALIFSGFFFPIRFFHQSHNTVHFGGLFTLKQWIFSSLKHDPVPRENKLYCFYVKNPPKRIALWDRENSQLLKLENLLR